MGVISCFRLLLMVACVSVLNAQDQAVQGSIAGIQNGSIPGSMASTPAAPGNSIILNGTSGYVAVPDAPSLHISGQALTVEAWAKREIGGDNNPVIVDKYYYRLAFDGTGKWQKVIFNLSTTGGGQQLTSNRSLRAGVWNHIAAVYDGSKVKLYINGILDNTLALTGSVYTSSDSLRMGRYYAGSYYYLKGQLDEVRVWSIARDSLQIPNGMSGGLTGSETGLAGYWRFDESSGTTTYDATANGNNGILRGGASFVRPTALPIAPVVYAKPGNGGATLSWTPLLPATATAYRIYRSMASSSRTLIAIVNVPTTSFVDASLINDTTYYYQITGVDGTGSEGDYSLQAVVTPHAGLSGNGVLLNGTTGYVAVADDPALHISGQALTVETWAKREIGGDNNPVIVDKYYYRLAFDGTGKWQKVIFNLSTTGGGQQLTSNLSLRAGVWNHVAAVYDGSRMKLYINGVLDNSIALTGNVYTSSDSLRMGRYYAGSYYYLKGQLDEVRVWSIARDSLQIQSGMISGLTGSEAGLAACWHLDELNGTTTYDATANGNNGILRGGASFVRPTALPVAPVAYAKPGSGKVTLSWTPSSITTAAVYRIYRWMANSSRTLIANVNPPATSYVDSPLINDTTYYYQMTAVDATGSEGDYSLQVAVTPHASLSGNGILLNGTTGYVAVGDDPALRLSGQALTLEAWVKREIGGDNSPVIVDKYYYRLAFDGTGKSQKVIFNLSTTGGSQQLTSNRSLWAGVWHHIAGVYDGSKMKLYIDGNLDNTLALTGSVSTGSDSLKMGRYYSGSNYYLKGQLDEVRVWNVARDSQQVLTGMVSGFTGNETGLAGYWRMDESSGTTTYDATVNGNQGILRGGASFGPSSLPPAPARSLQASTSGLKVNLKWTSSVSSNLLRYRVYRRLYTDEYFAMRDSTLPSIATFVDSVNLKPGLTYYYMVRALDDTFQESDTSNIVLVTMTGGTTVLADINSNTTWKKDGSPFKVIQNISIGSGNTLTIEAGTIVQLDLGVSITVNGVLRAIGTQQDSIRFTSLQPGVAPSQWKSLVFSNKTMLPGSELRYCIVEFGGSGYNAAISSGTSGILLQIANSLIWKNAAGIYLPGTNTDSVSYSTVVRNTDVGINTSGSVIVFKDSVAQNGGNGINAQGTVNGCCVSGNGYIGINGSGTMRGNTVWSNKNAGVALNGQSLVDSNIVSANSGGGISGTSNVTLRRNLVFDNTGSSGLFNVGSGSTVENNTIVKNAGGITNISSSSVVVRNNIVAFNATNGMQTSFSPAPLVKFNNIFSNATNWSGFSVVYGNLTGKNLRGDPADAFMNISLDPQFADTSKDIYLLTKTSRMIDAGDSLSSRDPDSTSSDLGAFYLSQAAPPGPLTITSFSPTSGPVGTTVTITGTSFNTTSGNMIVYFGAAKGIVKAATATSLTVSVPAGATYAPISVTDVTTRYTAYSARPFTVTFASNRVIDASSFVNKMDFAVGTHPNSIVITDLDGDGKPDLAVSNWATNNFSVFRNTSSSGSITAASFAPRADISTGNGPAIAAIGDLDGDGKPDIVIPNTADNSISIFRNTSAAGTISFAPRIDLPTGNTPSRVTIADMDGDGRPDIIIANGTSSTMSIYRNTSTAGSISVAARVDIPTGSSPADIAVGDVDGDGKPDIAIANSLSNTISVFRNISVAGSITTSSFAPKVDLPTGSGDGGLALADLDGDGKFDLATSNSISNSLSVLRNTSTSGSISFVAAVDIPTDTNPLDVAVGDLDGDGKPDLVVANHGSNNVCVFRNTSTPGSLSTSSFAAKISLVSATAPNVVAIGDIDGDGKPDLVVSNESGNSVSIFRNIVSGPVQSLPGEYSSDANTVLLLHMNETSGSSVSDASGNGNNGTATGTAIADGRFGKARLFGSAGDSISIPNKPWLNLATGFTIECWVKRTGNPSDFEVVFAKRSPAGENYGLYLGPSGAVRFQFTQGYGNLIYLDGSSAVTDGQWHHIAGSYDGVTMKVFIDGVVQTTRPQAGNVDVTVPTVSVGNSSNGYLFHGTADEIRISNKVRSAQEFNLQLPPVSLSASISGTTASLNWQNGGGSVGLLRYKIYRGTDSTNVSLIDSTTATAYLNTGLVSGTKYYYRVSAVDSTSFEGIKSFAVGTTTSYPLIGLSATNVPFGNVAVSSSSQQSISVLNTGTAPLVVASVASSNAAVFDVPTGGFTVSAGGSATLTVTFKPTAAQAYSGTITINHNAAGSPTAFNVSGTGTTSSYPVIGLSVTSLPFGSTIVSSSSQQSINVLNTGTAPLVVASVASNDPTVFDVPTAGFTVSAGGSATLTVTFKPTALQTYSGTITISHNAAGSPTTFNVTGTGVAAGAPAIALSASSLSFGNVNIGANSQKTFTVSNSGTATLNVSNITSNGGAFTANPTSFNIASGGSPQTVTVTFSPLALQTYSATLTLTHNASGSPSNISLTGTGIGSAVISLSQPSVSFGNVNLGSTTSQTLIVTNSGAIALTVTNITGGNSTFAVSPTSFTLAPGNSQTLTFTFTATAAGSLNGSLVFVSNAVSNPTITLGGTVVSRVTASSTQAGRFSAGIPPSTWVLLSVPYNLDNATSGILSTQLSGTNPWVMYWYQNGQMLDYSQQSGAFTITRGLWFKTIAKNSSFNLSFGAGELAGGSSYSMTVPAGWSLVGPPFLYEEASWTPVNTSPGSSGIRVYKYLHENNAGWQLLNPSSERMKPYGGYAVYNGTGASATFTFVRGGPLTSIQEWQPGDGWYSVLAVGETRLRIGQHRMASAGEDGLDYPMPPPRPDPDAQDPYVSEKLWSDIKPLGGNAVTKWNVTLDPRTSSGLKLQELAELPEGWEVMIDGIPNLGAIKVKEGEEIRFSRTIQSPIVVTVLVGPAKLVENEALPKQFTLYQNYPNPFNPSTTIRYGLAAESGVSVRVYNILGTQVRTLVQENQKPGYYTVRWEGCDDRGMAVSSGIYFVRVTVGGRSEVKKMVLVR